MSTAALHQVDVLVAGAGPCGLMLANELGLRGVSCLVVDPKATTAFNPQANATQARTMEHFRRIGLSAQIRALGLPADHPTDIVYLTRFAGHELARLRLPTAAQATAQIKQLRGAWSAAELPHRVSQKFVEAVLRDNAARLPGIDIRFGCRLQDFQQSSSAINATLEDAHGSRTAVQARYLVGADGARSAVRAKLGIGYGGPTSTPRAFMGGKMFAIYLRAPAFYAHFGHDLAWMYVTFNADRRVFLASVDGQGEFAFHAAVRADETPELWTHEDAARIFREASGMSFPIDILSTGIWIAGHSLVAQRYQEGRVFIAGDAAHLFTPTGGLGYNTAVGDAVNLGWKLASVIKGTSHASLLDSYEQERRPIGLRNTAYARQFADSVGLLEASPELEGDDATGQAQRAVVSEALNAHARREFNIPGVTFGERYDASPLIFADPTDVPTDSANDYLPSTSPGGRLPHAWLADQQSLFDSLHFEWTVLASEANAAEAGRIAAVGRAAGLAVGVLTLDVRVTAEVLGDDILIVRPDQMVAWRGTTAPQPDAVWARVAALVQLNIEQP